MQEFIAMLAEGGLSTLFILL